MDRKNRIGGSEVAALFGLDEYKSYWRLWHEKAGNIEPEDVSNNEDVEDGIYYEEPTARLFAKRNDLTIEKGMFHSSSEIEGFGGTTDFLISSKNRNGKGVLEVKNTGWRAYDTWKHTEPPMHYQLQLQAYMGLSGLKWGMLAIAVDRKLLPPFEYEFRPKIFAAIEQKVVGFWQSIKEGREPPQEDDDRSVQLIRKELIDEPADLSSDADLSTMLKNYQNRYTKYRLAREEYKTFELQKNISLAEIVNHLHQKRINSNNVICNGVQLITKTCPDVVVKEHTRKGGQKLIIKLNGEENE